MAKKKVNVRKDYSYEAKTRLPAYARPKAQRQMQFLILRGPGLLQTQVIAENEEIKTFGLRQRVKVKFLLAQTSEDAAKLIKESFTYATGVVFNPANLDVKEESLVKSIAKLKIPFHQIKAGESTADSYIDAIKLIITARNEV